MLRNAVRTSVKNNYTIGIVLNLLGNENLEKIPEKNHEKSVGWNKVIEMYVNENEKGGYIDQVNEAKRLVCISRERYCWK